MVTPKVTESFTLASSSFGIWTNQLLGVGPTASTIGCGNIEIFAPGTGPSSSRLIVVGVARRFNCRVLPLQLSTTADVWDGVNFTAVQNTAIAQQQPCDCPTDHTRCQTKETRDSRSHSTKAVGQNCQNVCYRLLMTSNNSTKPHTDVARHSQNTVIH